MSKREVCKLPAQELYWTKEKFSNKAAELENKISKAKTLKTRSKLWDEFLVCIKTIQFFERRMQELGI